MTKLPPLPAQPDNTPFPTQAWPESELPASLDSERFNELIDRAFEDQSRDQLGETHAFLAVQGGRIVFEKYWRDFTAKHTYPSWSMAKSMTHALVGIAAGEGLLDIHAPADVPRWQQPGDERAAITLDQLLRMSSGLAFQEDYTPDSGSDVITMLFGEGREDVAAYAASFPLTHSPGAHWSYASGTTNIVSRRLSRALGKSGNDLAEWMRARLFGPLGMTSAIPKFDEAGTFIGSSYCFCTVRDFARFGLLYLRDGVWEGGRILPEGWADYARTPTPTPPGEPLGYGAHWWLGVCGPGSFSANGFGGQYTVIVPELDLIFVRSGASPETAHENLRGWLAGVADCFRA